MGAATLVKLTKTILVLHVLIWDSAVVTKGLCWGPSLSVSLSPLSLPPPSPLTLSIAWLFFDPKRAGTRDRALNVTAAAA